LIDYIEIDVLDQTITVTKVGLTIIKRTEIRKNNNN